jgi:hypothetical protein
MINNYYEVYIVDPTKDIDYDLVFNHLESAKKIKKPKVNGVYADLVTILKDGRILYINAD